MNSTVTKEKKISSQKELLTIIIPTKNRPYLLNRSLGYFVSAEISVRIIIIDSSSDTLLNKVKLICDDFCGNLDIDYHHVDTNMEYSSKISIAADMVDTPYSLLVGDDDFPLKSAIEELLFKLENNKSIVAAFGERLAITQIDEKASSFKWVKSYPNYSGISITNSNILDRIRCLPIPVWQQYPNAIIRTIPFKEAYKMAKELDYTQYSEFFISSYILTYGEWVKYDVLFTVCHQENKFCKFKDRYIFSHYIGSGGSILDGISQDKWSKTVSLLCEIVGKKITTSCSQDFQDISNQLRIIYYSKLVYYLEYNIMLSNNLINNDGVTLRVINNIFRKLSKFYWIVVLYDKSGGIFEFIKFFLNFGREVLNGRFLRLVFNSITDTNIKGLLVSIKRTGSLKYESDSLLRDSSKYYKEYQVIFNTWIDNPCPQRLKEFEKK